MSEQQPPRDAVDNAAEVISALARSAAGPNAEPVNPDETPLLLVREGQYNDGNHGQWAAGVTDKVRVLDLSAWATVPGRRSGGLILDEPASFEAYVNEFKVKGSTRLYANLEGAQLIAVFNDDVASPSGPGAWRDHRATLRLKRTPEWQAWRQLSGKKGGQREFAEFLEEHLDDITQPDAADLVEIARTFTASNKVTFRSGVNLTNGETRFQYDEELEGKAGATAQIDIPREFTLSLAIYEGTHAVQVTARLRWSLRDGNLLIGYVLVDADRLERDQFRAGVELTEAAVGLEALYGSPALPPSERTPF